MRYSEVHRLDQSIEGLLDTRRDKAILPEGCPEIVSYSDDVYFRELRMRRTAMNSVCYKILDMKRAFYITLSAAAVIVCFMTMTAQDLVSHEGSPEYAGANADGTRQVVDGETGLAVAVGDSSRVSARGAAERAGSEFRDLIQIDLWLVGEDVIVSRDYLNHVDDQVITVGESGGSISPGARKFMIDEAPNMLREILTGERKSVGDTTIVIDGGPRTFKVWESQSHGPRGVKYLVWRAAG